MRVIDRPVTEDDRKQNVYFSHMAGLAGVVTNVYSPTQIAVKIDEESMKPVAADVQKTATLRMREKFLANISEEQKKGLTKEELEFDANYVLLVQGSDLEKA